MVWLPWVLVGVAFGLGLVIGGLVTRFWLVRAGPAIVPTADGPTVESGTTAVETAEVPPAHAEAAPEPEPDPEPELEPDLEADPYTLDAYEEGDEEEGPDEHAMQPASDLQAALQAHHDVLEKLEAKYRNASAPPDEETPAKRRRKVVQ